MRFSYAIWPGAGLPAGLVKGVLQRPDVALRGVRGAGDRVDAGAARRQRLLIERGDRVGVDLVVARRVLRVLGGGDRGDLAALDGDADLDRAVDGVDGLAGHRL